MWLFEFGNIDELVFYVFCAVAGVVAVVALAGFVVQCCTEGFSGASSMDFVTGLGTIVLCYTVLVRGLDPDWGNAGQYKAICAFYPAALLMGLTCFIGGIFAKAWGVYLYNKFNNDRKPMTEEWKANMWIWVLLLVAGAASIVWCAVFTPEIKYLDESGEKVDDKSDAKTYECDYEAEQVWIIATSVWHAVLLLLATVAIIPNCKVAHQSEAHVHSLITLNTLLATVAGVCAHYLYDDNNDNETAEYAINGGLILWACLFNNVFSLGAKLCTTRRSSKGKEPLDNYDTIRDRNSGYQEPGQNNENFSY